MKKSKSIISFILIVALLVSVFISGMVTKNQNLSGKASSICTITPICEKWILDNFGHYNSVEEVVVAYDNFACRNFTYEKKLYFQNFDFEGFITEDNFHGVCFEFTCTLKCILYVLFQKLDAFKDIKSYVCCVTTSSGEGHCYNIIFNTDRCYKIDITSDVTTFKENGDLPIYYMDYTGYSIEEIVSICGDKMFMLV